MRGKVSHWKRTIKINRKCGETFARARRKLFPLLRDYYSCHRAQRNCDCDWDWDWRKRQKADFNSILKCQFTAALATPTPAHPPPACPESFAYTSDFIICFQFSLRGIFKAAANGLQGTQPRHFYGILICGLNYSTPPLLPRPKHLRHQLAHLPSLLRGVMIPTRLFLPQHIGHLDKATEMQCLAIG